MKIVTDLSVTSAPTRVRGGLGPTSLFAAGAKGFWFSASYLSAFFQNAGGTMPVTSAGQPVGLIKDKSGNGLDFSQSGATARPVLAVEPATGRRNLSSRSEPSVAELALSTGVSDATTGLAGFDATIQFPDSGAGNRFAYRDHGAEPSVEYTLSCFVEMDDGGKPSPGTDFGLAIGNASAGTWGAVTDLGGGLFRVSKTATSLTSGLSNTGVYKTDAHSARGYRVSGFQLEEGPAVSAYQKAVSAYDLREAGVPAVHALDFDGVDDRMLTGTLDLTHTSQVTVVAALSKSSDPFVRGTVVNFVDNGFNNFTLEVPLPNNPDTRWLHVGSTTLRSVGHALALDTRVLYTGLSDISAPRAELRANGVSTAVDTSITGGGTFKSGPLAIGDYVTPAGRNFDGRIYSLLVIDRILTASEITMTEGYMAARAGIAL